MPEASTAGIESPFETTKPEIPSRVQVKASTQRLPENLLDIVGDPALLKKPEGMEVAVYTFPNYHPSALHDRLYAKGWTEYTIVRGTTPWFEGHQQPRTPLLGELDESLPSTWETYNRLAKMHGVEVLLWDWYWYEGKPQLHEALEEGFLKAKNTNDVKFACMWCNHPWYILFPSLRTNNVPQYPPSFDAMDVSVEESEKSLRYIVDRYFDKPNHWKIGGKHVICVWDPNRLEKRLGVQATKEMFERVENYAVKKGYKGIHLHSTGFYSPKQKEMGFDTAGSYNPLTGVGNRRPKEEVLPDMGVVAADVVRDLWPAHHKDFNVPYIPSLGVGWDSSSRFVRPFERPEKPNRDVWPRSLILQNEHPSVLKAFVQGAIAYLNKHPEVPRVVTIACWNEWSEGHSLLPDTRWGFGMLEALAEAVGIEGTFDRIGYGKF